MRNVVKCTAGICFLMLTLPYIMTLLINGRQGIHQEEPLPVSEYQVLYELSQQNFTELDDGVLELMAILCRTEELRLQKEYQVEQLSMPSDSAYYERLLHAVQNTEGQVVQIAGEYRELPYHAVSAGSTRSGELLGEDWFYVRSVACADDLQSDAYLQICYLSRDEFAEALDTNLSVGDLEFQRDAAGYVMTVRCGEQNWTGETIRDCLHLASGCFYMESVGDTIRVTTKGSGHGFGISLYTAGKMMQAGASVTEVFQKFYQNAECITIR